MDVCSASSRLVDSKLLLLMDVLNRLLLSLLVFWVIYKLLFHVARHYDLLVIGTESVVLWISVG